MPKSNIIHQNRRVQAKATQGTQTKNKDSIDTLIESLNHSLIFAGNVGIGSTGSAGSIRSMGIRICNATSTYCSLPDDSGAVFPPLSLCSSSHMFYWLLQWLSRLWSPLLRTCWTSCFEGFLVTRGLLVRAAAGLLALFPFEPPEVYVQLQIQSLHAETFFALRESWLQVFKVKNVQ